MTRMHDLPARIRFFRHGRNWTMRELATRLGCSRSTVKSWEQGRCAPNMHTLVALVAVFDVTLPEFFSASITGSEQAGA